MANVDKTYYKLIQTRLIESAKVKQKTAEKCINSIYAAIELIINTFNSSNKVLICGNGGSAADSQHMAGEFVCILNKTFDRPGLPAIALTTDTSILTAHANDMGFENIFKRQIQALGNEGDTLVAISTSGNSSNILSAVKYAKSAKIRTIALTGDNGKLARIVDIAIKIPSNNTQYIQESHIAIEHIICESVEHRLYKKSVKR